VRMLGDGRSKELAALGHSSQWHPAPSQHAVHQHFGRSDLHVVSVFDLNALPSTQAACSSLSSPSDFTEVVSDSAGRYEMCGACKPYSQILDFRDADAL
jgi:hypothetical protein